MTKLFKTGMSEATKALMIRFNERTYVVYMCMYVFMCMCVCVCAWGRVLGRGGGRGHLLKQASDAEDADQAKQLQLRNRRQEFGHDCPAFVTVSQSCTSRCVSECMKAGVNSCRQIHKNDEKIEEVPIVAVERLEVVPAFCEHVDGQLNAEEYGERLLHM